MNPTSLALTAGLSFFVCATAATQQHTTNPHGKLQQECAVCHRPEAWVPARISSTFDHAKRGIALSGAHAQAACRSCHASLDFRGAPSACLSCHRDVHRGELGNDCSRCHTARSFLDRSVMARAHQMTRFALSGAHLTVDCEACHRPAPQGRLAFVSLPGQCVDCHRDQYQLAKNPDHVAGAFPQNCNQCHAPTIWAAARFNHDASGFPLTGAHRAIPCAQCHGTTYTSKSTACVSCHQTDYDGTTSPNHATGGLPTTCQDCHSTTSWSGASFDHSRTGCPLTGAHRTVACLQCHGDNVYAGKSTACVSCHQQDYDGTTNPSHAPAGFPTSCQDCHSTSTWTGARFTHTWFPIPHHGADACSDCHTNSADYSTFVCTICHTKSSMDPKHSGVSGYVWNSTN
ncbi:MAG TPA: hypothetical protein VFU41_15220, partial [Gemmatimonadales bacterium]|nr:hypothetical protein [Gemmatimonadales bacterium]